jgi:UDP-2-acetamido-3-amino-2,3-dideoxy-glucuronate N-acetyltransferase
MKNVKIHPTAEVAKDCTIGDGTKIWNNAQVRENAHIGKDCIISKDVYIDTEVRIGDRVKIQNGVSVYKGVTVEDDVFLGPHMTFTNDMYPRAFSKHWEVVPTLVKKGASIGANATVVCGKTVGEYAMVAAGSVVTRDVPAHTLVMGNPARIKGLVCKCGRKLADSGADMRDPGKALVCEACGERLLPDRL